VSICRRVAVATDIYDDVMCGLKTQAVVWSADLETDWKAFSVPLELEESITAVDFSSVGISDGR